MQARAARGGLRAALAAALVWFAGAAAAMSSAPSCQRQVLVELGWRFEAADGSEPRILAGAPCDRETLADAQAHGDLRVAWPSDLDDAQQQAFLGALLQHPATHCAYAFVLGDATRRAVDKLVANPRYRFFGLQGGWIGFGPGGARADGWTPIRSFGRGLHPAASNWNAMQAFYSGTVRAECGVGRQVAQYATQAELYGADAFDRVFEREEIVIGTFNQLHGTRSILLGSSAGTFTRDGRAEQASRDGRQAFAGLPGFIEHVFDADTLDDRTNQAENFVIYDVDAEAAAALRSHGGFAHYNRINREIWELSRSVNPHAWGRGFERLLIDRDAALLARQGPAARATLARMQALLDDPFYRGTQIYVHKLGVKPVGFHIARLLDRNPRTPYRIELVLHNLHTTLYDRYIAHRIGVCAAHQSVGL